MTNYIGRGSIENLSKILKDEEIKTALIFRGKSSYEAIKQVIEKELKNVEFQYFSDFSTNPKFEEIQFAIKELSDNFDIIIAIGGGSVIDFAKAYRYYTKPLKLIVIPTTCGTGSEATQFAVVYKDGVKTSLDESSILPQYAIVDSQFVENNPKYLKACTAMDAYCQAIESYWAVKSTDESREYAKQAIELCRDNIVKYVNSTNKEPAENMCLASNLAGKAINISRTTAAHALSYKITSEYDIPHGHAVALTITNLYTANKAVCELNCNDIRGVEFVKTILNNLELLLNSNIKNYFNDLFIEIGLESGLKKLGIADADLIIKSVNIDRLGNNPVRLTKMELKNILEKNNEQS